MMIADVFEEGNIHRQFAFPSNRTNLPSPPHTGQMRSVSTFDLAPLPHPNFVSMAALSMPLGEDVESDQESYHSAQASPTFAPAKVSIPAANHPFPAAFQNNMPSLPEEPAAEIVETTHTMIKVPPLPTGSTVSIKRSSSPGETESPLGANFNGITTEEISSFISGPEKSDSKWVCLFPECGKRFGRKENIKSHVQTHLGDRQYRCDVCRKCFVRQHDLKRHAKIHTGVKPYPCLCGNSFARHDALTRHRQRGMCIGAFEGIVKKMAKRGRPRKRPLEEGEEPRPKKFNKPKAVKTEAHSSGSSSSGSSCGSDDASEMRTPREFNFSTPIPDTRSSTPSIKDSSPHLVHSNQSSDDTPPTSPPDFGSFEEFLDHHHDKGTNFPEQHDLDYAELGLSLPQQDRKYSMYSSSGGSSSSGTEDDEFLFSQEGVDILGLSTLERDPTILHALTSAPGYIKPEMLSSST